MKKININCIVFAAVSVFIIVGLCGNTIPRMNEIAKETISGLLHSDTSSVNRLTDNIDEATSKKLSYHGTLMDINSIKENLLGTRIIKKDDTTIIKSDSGSLGALHSTRLSDKEIADITFSVKKLQKIAEDNDSGFLYCAAPAKEQYESFPTNIHSYKTENYESFLNSLKENQIPCLDFSIALSDNGLTGHDAFFYTDHHWKPNTGLIASKTICEELGSRYGFEYYDEYTDIQNYNIENYPDFFLGSYGKKVGTYFSWYGADDFELITPKFRTDLIEEQPLKNEIRQGSFEDTVLFLDNMKKDYYNVTPYATYSGGDFRLQIIKNNLNPDGKKILLIRDSFAGVVSPFLSLQTSELHICDMRNFEYFVGDKINVEDYIKKIKPDYVIVLYSGISGLDNTDGRYDFF